MENKYEKAIKNNEVEDFLFGRGEYLYTDKENILHMSLYTYEDIERYGKLFGYEKMLIQLEKDIKTIFKKDITPSELSTIIGYIYIYMRRYYEEKRYPLEFKVDKELKSLISKNFSILNDKYSEASIVLDYDKKEDNPGYFLNNSKRIINMIKEKFEINLLDT